MCIYLPPENLFHGRDGYVLFNYINALFDQYLDESYILLSCGYINAIICNINGREPVFSTWPDTI